MHKLNMVLKLMLELSISVKNMSKKKSFLKNSILLDSIENSNILTLLIFNLFGIFFQLSPKLKKFK
jgi:hypothetical protein